MTTELDLHLWIDATTTSGALQTPSEDRFLLLANVHQWIIVRSGSTSHHVSSSVESYDIVLDWVRLLRDRSKEGQSRIYRYTRWMKVMVSSFNFLFLYLRI